MNVRAAPSTVVLALNAGSSSLKFGLYLVDAHEQRMLVSGTAETIRDRRGALSASDANGNALVCDARPIDSPQTAVDRIADLLDANGFPTPTAIGHRIVHGGPDCRRHALIDATLIRQLERAAVFAPLHAPFALALVASAQHRFPTIAQVACLDTAFHAGMPDVARTLPIARELRVKGMQRYGFHGLSCESIVRQIGIKLPPRLVIAHLGHGASVTAVANGRSIDTSMGMTPSGGVIMSTRCGDIDPGVLEYLVRELHYDAAQLEAMIDQQSGMYGLSGLSGDMRELREVSASDPNARLAIAMFCYSVRKQIGAMAAVLGGTDCLVFTGGIGENDAATRDSICEGLDWLGIRIGSQSVLVMQSQEDAQIALNTWHIIDCREPSHVLITVEEDDAMQGEGGVTPS